MGQNIRLVHYEERYHQDLTRFTLKNEQVHFTALPAEVIEEAMVNPDKDPLVILHQAVPVGFFVLHKGSEYVKPAEADRKILIRALSVSEEYQGKGYAMEAMKQLPDWVREFHPEMEEIILAVNEANKAARQLYLRCGFRDLGLTRMGSHGLQAYFTLQDELGVQIDIRIKREERIMKAEIRTEDLNSPKLSWLCIEPMLLSVRGQSVEAKREVYLRLNQGQQALYLFYSFHNHTKSLAEFYWFSAYNIIDLRSWNGIRKGMQFFDLHEMVNVLNDIEIFITDAKKSGETWHEVSPTDLQHHPQLLQQTELLYAAYRQASQQAVTKMNEWVRRHQDLVLTVSTSGEQR